MNFPIDDDTVILTQQVLVQIWQLHINDWYNGAENFLIIPNQITRTCPTSLMPTERCPANPFQNQLTGQLRSRFRVMAMSLKLCMVEVSSAKSVASLPSFKSISV